MFLANLEQCVSEYCSINKPFTQAELPRLLLKLEGQSLDRSLQPERQDLVHSHILERVVLTFTPNFWITICSVFPKGIPFWF